MTLKEQGRLEVIKSVQFAHVSSDDEDQPDQAKGGVKKPQGNKVLKVATNSWQSIIKDSRRQKQLNGQAEAPGTVEFNLDFGEESAAAAVKVEDENHVEKP